MAVFAEAPAIPGSVDSFVDGQAAADMIRGVGDDQITDFNDGDFLL